MGSKILRIDVYFRRFVKDFAVTAKPLSDLLRQNTKFKFDVLQKVAFEQLKVALTCSPALNLYNPKLETEIHTDASKYGFCGVFLQKDPEDCLFHPVQYMSRKTNQCEEKYHSYELEVLAVIGALMKWSVYVLGLKFKIVTDRNAFTMTMKKKDLQDFDTFKTLIIK